MAKWIVGVVALVMAALAMPAQAGRWSIGYSDYVWNGGYSISVGAFGHGHGWYAPSWYAPGYRDWYGYGYSQPRVVYRSSYPRHYGYGYGFDRLPPYRYESYRYVPRYYGHRDWRRDRHVRYDRYWNDRRDRYSRNHYDRYDRYDRGYRHERAYDRSRRDAYYNAHDDAWRGQRGREYD